MKTSTSSQRDSRANHTRSQEKEMERKTTVLSGLKCIERYGKLGRVGLLGKMLLASSTWTSTGLSLTWKRLNTPSRCLLFQLAPSEQSTDENALGLLPTPRASMRHRWWRRQEYRCNLEEIPCLQEFSHLDGKAINIQWLECFIGYPTGWTELKESETPSSLKSRRRSCVVSKKSKFKTKPKA